MKTYANFYKIFLMLAVTNFLGCEEQKEQALEYFNKSPAEETDPSNLERFGFDDKPTPLPTNKKVAIPFDNERTRQGANSN